MEGECFHCGIYFEFTLNGLHKCNLQKFCSKECSKMFRKGKSKVILKKLLGETRINPYPKEFIEAKKRTRLLQNYTCLLCGEFSKSIPVHHIDYDKDNCDDSNLTCLCERCHNGTNHNRTLWENFITNIIKYGSVKHQIALSEVKIDDSKYIVCFKNKQLIYSPNKNVQWECCCGKLIIEDNHKQVSVKELDSIKLVSSSVYTITPLCNSFMLETIS